MDFVCRENANGSLEIYNTKIGDIYFSNVGAHKEAYEKFVMPSLPVIEKKSKIQILDVCYGMGYNSKTFFDFLVKNNINLNYEIDAIELDKNILSLGLFLFDKNIQNDIHLYFGKKILEAINLEENIKNISGEICIKQILDQNQGIFDEISGKIGVDLYQSDKISSFLHNIYYRNQYNFEKKINFGLFCGDLHKILPTLSAKYDLIFHDAFSILKQPDMWSEDVLLKYYNILNENGRLLTYSNSRVLRRRLNEIGFTVEINYTNENKQNGTIAIKT